LDYGDGEAHASRCSLKAGLRCEAAVGGTEGMRQEQISIGRYHMGIADVSRSFIERSIVMHEKPR
jgi:hypothetical protein